MIELLVEIAVALALIAWALSPLRKLRPRCAVPGCDDDAVVHVYDRSGGSDLVCVTHAREELEVAARFGTDDVRDAARRLLDGGRPT